MLQKAIDICRANEVTSAQMKSLGANGISTEPVDIQAIQKEDTTKEPCPRCCIWHTKQQQCSYRELNVENLDEETIFLSMSFKDNKT